MIYQSKQILPATGYLEISFTFKVIEKKSRKLYLTHGKSKIFKNIKTRHKLAINNAIYDGYKKVFPSGTYTLYNIKIRSYNINYFVENYKIVKKNNKQYERWLDTESRKTRYSVISDKKVYSKEQEGFPKDIKG